jgi:recombination protein RecA
MTERDRQRAIQLKLSRLEEHPRPGSQPAVPTPWPELNVALGTGGFERGGIVEIFGPSGSGKTTVALGVAASVHQQGGAAAWIDAEHAFDARYAATRGVQLDGMPVMQPESAEQAFEMARQLVASSALDLLVVDSAAALVPALELETALGAVGAGLQSRILASGLQKLARVTSKSDTVVLFLNQTRSAGGPTNGDAISAGGPALKLHARLRLGLAAASQGRIRFRILKNKAAEAFQEGELWLNPAPKGAKSP